MEINIFLPLLPWTLLPPLDLNVANTVFFMYRRKNKNTFFFFKWKEEDMSLAVSFYIKSRWHNIPLLQVTCNYLRTAKENGRQVYFSLLSFVLFNQTWQVTGMSRRAGWKCISLIILTVWYGLAFFAPSQALMFPSKRLINPFIYRLQQPLGEKKTTTKPAKQTKLLKYKHWECKFIFKLLSVLQQWRAKTVTCKKILSSIPSRLLVHLPWVSSSFCAKVCFSF